MISKALYSSKSGEWETPQQLIGQLNKEFGITLDVCASAENAKAPKYYTREVDGLAQDWHKDAGDGFCFCNPPYGRGVGEWAKKAYIESRRGAKVVMLLPARTDTRWFQDWVLGKAEIRFIRGRLRFVGAASSAPFPSLLAIYWPGIAAGNIPRTQGYVL